MFEQHMDGNYKWLHRHWSWLRPSLTSLLLIMVVVGVMFGSAVLSPSQKPRAYAAVDPNGDVTWYISDGASGYIQMINDIRTRVRARYIYNSTEEAKELDTTKNQFFHLNIHTDRSSSAGYVSIRMREDNLYVVGWSTSTQDYYTFPNDGTLPGASRNINLPYGADYTSLERAGGSRLGMAMGQASFVNSANTLANPGGTVTGSSSQGYNVGFNAAQNRAVAQGILTLVQGISEAARFPHISGGIRDSFGSPSSFKIDTKAIVFENNWSTLGNNLATGLTTANVPAFENGGVSLRTLADYGLALAIILYHSQIK